MPLPLVWIGAGVAAAVAGSYLNREQQKYDGHVAIFPGESKHRVAPVDGAIMCCGIYEMLQHTGIWVDGGIVELNGNGLFRLISPSRFLADRSGDRIYIACDEHGTPLVAPQAMARASAKIYDYADYHVLNNNCHRFTRYCITGDNSPLTLFSELNSALAAHFDTPVYWHQIQR